MRALALREARRLAPYGLGASALGAGALVTGHAEGAVPFFGSLAAAALLGVTAFAPDTARGGAVFLRTLPLPSWRVAAVKVAVALAWAVPASAPLALPLNDWHPGAAVGPPALGFGAGVLASVVSHRVTPALLIAPLVALLTALAGLTLPCLALGLDPAPLGFVVLPALAALSALLAVAAFAHGDRHRPTLRPALIAAAGLAPAFVLVFGATAAARDWTLRNTLPAALEVEGATALPGRPGLALELEATLWTKDEAWCAVLEADRAWLVPARNAVAPRPSPDGRFLLLEDGQGPGGWLVDLDARTTTALTGRGSVGFGYDDVVWGPDGVVALVRGHGAVDALYPAAASHPGRAPDRACAHRPVPGASYVGLTDDGRALLVDPEGALVCDLPRPGAAASTPPERLLAWPDGLAVESALSLPGRRLLVASTVGAVLLFDLTTGAMTPLDDAGERAPGPLRRGAITLSPSGRLAAFSTTSAVLCYDLATGARVAAEERPTDAPRGGFGRAPAWSASERALALPWCATLFLDEHPLGDRHCAAASPHSHPALGERVVAGFVLDRVVPRGQPLTLARPFSDEAVRLTLKHADGGAR